MVTKTTVLNMLKVFHDDVTDFMESFTADSFVARTTPVAFSIAKSAWQKNNSETSEFVYFADITANGLTAKDYAEVTFNRTSQKVVAEANVCTAGETMADKIRIYAENVPTATVGGEYIIMKGAV